MELEKRKGINELPAIPGSYGNDIRVFNRYASGRQITGELVVEYFDDMKVLGRRTNTINRHKAAIKKALLDAMGRGASIAQVDQLGQFFKGIKTGRASIKVLKEQTLSEDELKEMIVKAGEKTGLIIRALYESACRISELVNIRLDDCVPVKGGVKIRVLGKGSKERFVFMKAETVKAIKKAYKGETYLFEVEGKPLSRLTAYTLIKRMGARIGRADIHPHTMRHSFATNRLMELGIDSIGAYLGHSDPSITAKYYLHSTPSIEKVLQGAI